MGAYVSSFRHSGEKRRPPESVISNSSNTSCTGSSILRLMMKHCKGLNHQTRTWRKVDPRTVCWKTKMEKRMSQPPDENIAKARKLTLEPCTHLLLEPPQGPGPQHYPLKQLDTASSPWREGQVFDKVAEGNQPEGVSSISTSSDQKGKLKKVSFKLPEEADIIFFCSSESNI